MDYDEAAVSTAGVIITALAGPVFSLVMGLVVMVVARSWGRGFCRLFWMWLSFMGVMNFVGYCFIAPFAQAGDTGQALALLGAPGWVCVLVGLVGVAVASSWLARRFAVEVKRYADGRGRGAAARPSSAWIIGTPVVIVLTVVELSLLQAPSRPHFVVGRCVRRGRRGLRPDAVHLPCAPGDQHPGAARAGGVPPSAWS